MDEAKAVLRFITLSLRTCRWPEERIRAEVDLEQTIIYIFCDTGFPLKIGKFPTYFDTFSIDSVFFN